MSVRVVGAVVLLVPLVLPVLLGLLRLARRGLGGHSELTLLHRAVSLSHRIFKKLGDARLPGGNVFDDLIDQWLFYSIGY